MKKKVKEFFEKLKTENKETVTFPAYLSRYAKWVSSFYNFLCEEGLYGERKVYYGLGLIDPHWIGDAGGCQMALLISFESPNLKGEISHLIRIEENGTVKVFPFFYQDEKVLKNEGLISFSERVKEKLEAHLVS